MEDLLPLVKQGGAIIGLTALIGKTIPEKYKALRDILLPWVAMVLGVGTIAFPKYQAGELITVDDIQLGIVLGGSLTGLYAVVKR